MASNLSVFAAAIGFLFAAILFPCYTKAVPSRRYFLDNSTTDGNLTTTYSLMIKSDNDDTISKVDRVTMFLKELEAKTEMAGGKSRGKRSTGCRRRLPKWFMKFCLDNFCGAYSCDTFLHEKGQFICKHCRYALCCSYGETEIMDVGNTPSCCYH